MFSILLISLSMGVFSQAPKIKKSQPAEKSVAANVSVTPGPKKKDGSADMRFKANKKNAVGPKKKDGSPDMRYKSNQINKKKS